MNAIETLKRELVRLLIESHQLNEADIVYHAGKPCCNMKDQLRKEEADIEKAIQILEEKK